MKTTRNEEGYLDLHDDDLINLISVITIQADFPKVAVAAIAALQLRGYLINIDIDYEQGMFAADYEHDIVEKITIEIIPNR